MQSTLLMFSFPFLKLSVFNLWSRGRERMAREPGVALLMIAYGSLR